MHPGFHGKVYMTLPLMQIGQNLLLELVRLNQKRNSQKAQKMNYLQEAQMFDAFAAYGLADWQELYTEEDLTKFFQEHVVVLNHNEHHNFDSVVEITPVSSGYHIGSSCWSL
jgi:Cft2 family RNA processing exonuclease